jgi:hypothetical protein
MTLLTDEGDGIAGRRIVFIARKLDGPHLVRKSGNHRGLQGKLYDAEVYIDVAIEKTR